MTSPKILVLVRHAHRDTAVPSADNGLSKRGRRQAEAVKRFYKERFGKDTSLLISSPKKRCVETLEPLADKLGVRLRTDGRLGEGSKGLEERTQEFLSWWRDQAPHRVVACSHGDWIPEFLNLAVGATLPLKKGGWAELSLDHNDIRLETWLQSLP
jgi:8-oxo-dGTP diphosphatase